MLTTILQGMEEQTAAARAKGSARGLWLNEWVRMWLRAYEPEAKVVYVSTYAFPMEILAAFDVAPFDFELISGLMGLTGVAVPAMEEAEQRGYPMDVCSFHRTAVGAAYRRQLPAPGLMVTSSYFCEGKVKTNEILARMQGTESLLLQVPAAVTRDTVRYVTGQLRAIAGRIGQAAGQRMDEDRLKEAVRASNRATRVQRQMLDLLKHRPAPWGGRDLVAYSINSRMLAGTEAKVQADEAFLREMQGAIASGRLPAEKHRLLWMAWIPTYQTDVFEFLRDAAVSIPLCETFQVHWDEIDEDNPFEGLALWCLRNPFVGAGTRRTENLGRTLDDYHLDGAVLFATPACRQANAAYTLLRDAVSACGRRFLLLDMDISDPRTHSPGQTRTRLEAFVEVLGQPVH